MKELSLFFTRAAAVFASAACLHAQNFGDVEIRSTHVAGAVHMLEGAGGNIGVSAGPDGVLIIDDQFAPLAEKIEAALGTIEGGGELKFVLNTHWHGDHTGGNPHFGRKAPIVAHSNVRKRLVESEQRQMPKEGLPTLTFDESMSIHFNGEEIKVIHVSPGHTDGDSVIYFAKSNVAHLGDQFFNGRFPFIDLNSGGNVRGYIRNVEQILEKLPPDTKIIPGHGSLGSVEDLKKFHEMLRETSEIVAKGVREGKTLEQLRANGLPAKWEGWGSGFINTDRWIGILFQGLSEG